MESEKARLIEELRSLVFESVNLKHCKPEEVTESTSLMEHGLELDSIDILEIVVAVEHRYQVSVKDNGDGKRAFRTLGTIADFVLSGRS